MTKGTTPRGGNVAYTEKGVGFLRAENVAGMTLLDKNTLKYIDENTHRTSLSRSILEANDILVTIAGTLGRTALVKESDLPLNANQAVSIVRPVGNNVNLLYLIIALNSPSIFNELTLQKKTTAIPNLTLEIISNALIPIPPCAEQSRIVAEIERFEPLIAEYDRLEQQKTKIDNDIYGNLKKSILQYAIQGKLVPQNPSDEPASVLLERIRAEKKTKLGKKYVESYIYKGDDNCYYEKVGKNEPVRLDDLPFDIPDSWEWARIKDIVEINPRNNIDDIVIVSFVEMKSLKDGFHNDFNNEKRVWNTVKNGFTHFQNGDVGFAKITPCFQNRKSAIFSGLENGYGAGTTELHILRPYKNTILADYLLWFVKSPYLIEYGKKKFSGTAGQQRFGTDEVKNTLIPIPPQSEQLRISAKIKELFKKIGKDEINSRL